MSSRRLLDTFPMTQGQSRRTEAIILKNKKYKQKKNPTDFDRKNTGVVAAAARFEGREAGGQVGGRTCCSFLRLSLSDLHLSGGRLIGPRNWHLHGNVPNASSINNPQPPLLFFSPPTFQHRGDNGQGKGVGWWWWGRAMCWPFGGSGLASSPRTLRRKKRTWEIHLTVFLAAAQSKTLLTNLTK